MSETLEEVKIDSLHGTSSFNEFGNDACLLMGEQTLLESAVLKPFADMDSVTDQGGGVYKEIELMGVVDEALILNLVNGLGHASMICE